MSGVVADYPTSLCRPPGRRSLLSVGLKGAGVNRGGGQDLEGAAGASGWMGDKRAGTGATGPGTPSALSLVVNMSLWLESITH